MKVMITGGAGFVGSHLCRKLLYDGNEVICVDNFFSGRIKNVLDIKSNKRFSLIEGDISNKAVFDGMKQVEQVYNLACPASPVFYQKDSIQTLRTCFYGMENVLEYAGRVNAKVLQASTSEVYGDPLIEEQAETYFGNVNPNGVRSCYDEGKRVAETLCCEYRKKYAMDVKIIRIFNTYGPYMREDDGRVISNFINAALNNKDLVIYGDGTQTRSLCYITDLIEGMVGVMESSIDGPINIGNPFEVTIKRLAEIILSKVLSKSQIRYTYPLSDDPQIRKPNITKANTELGWAPKVELSQGLDETIAYYKKELGKISLNCETTYF